MSTLVTQTLRAITMIFLTPRNFLTYEVKITIFVSNKVKLGVASTHASI